MVSQALATVGVEAVVEGLKAFKDGFTEMNGFIDGFAKKGSFLGKVFAPVNAVLGTFFESLRRIGEFIVAGIVLRGIDMLASAIRNLAVEVFGAAVEFQKLKIRLETFIATEMIAAGTANNMTEALQMAVAPSSELFDWILKLAMTTPFDATDVADTLTMGKAWGFSTEEAKKLTIQVSDFASGMGFTSLEMDRVIKALGQMKSLGRVAGQELLQLANAGVPVADIMNNIREELGLTTEQFEDLRQKGGVSAELFFEQWDKLIAERFEGSAIRASGTIEAVVGNFKDLFTGMIGMKVLVPILDTLADKAAGFLNALVEGENFDRLSGAFGTIGESLSEILSFFMGGLPSEAGFAEAVVGYFERIAEGMDGLFGIIRALSEGQFGVTGGDLVTYILSLLGFSEGAATTAGRAFDDMMEFKDRVLEFVDTVREVIGVFQEEGFMAGLEAIGVPEPILNFISYLIGAFDNLKYFWEENKEPIMAVFDDVAEGIGKLLGFEASENPSETSLLEKIGLLIWDLSQTLVENGPTVVQWFEDIGTSITEDWLPAFREVADWITENQDTLLEFFGYVVEGMAWFWKMSVLFKGAVALFGLAVLAAIGWFSELGSNLGEFIDDVREKWPTWDEFRTMGWNAFKGLGDGMIEAIIDLWVKVEPKIRWLIDMIKSVLGISSPSWIFAEMGDNIMKGLGMGIEKAIKIPELAMKTAVKHIIQPAMNPMAMASTNNYSSVQNFNLNVSTQAKAEPIIADFRMMQSLAGGG